MNETKAARYQRLKRRARAAELGGAGVALGLFAFTPASPWTAHLAYRWTAGLSGIPEHAAALVVVVIAVALVVDIATLPASLYVALRLNPRYIGPATDTPEDVFGAHLQSLAVVLPVSLAAGAIVLATQAVAGPLWWWLLAGPLLAISLAAAVQVGPALLAGIGRVKPIERVDLSRRLADMAARAGVPVRAIGEWDVGSVGATAVITGVGRGRQILVAREILRHWSDDEIAVVVAHELGHAAHGDLWRTLLADIAAMWAALLASAVVVRGSGAATLPDYLGHLPAVAFVSLAVWMMTAPLRHAYSRVQERRADRFALELTGRGDALSATLRRLGAERLAEERPSALTRWFHLRHPSVGERVAAAEAFETHKAAH